MQIGNLTTENNVFLAPMAGVTDGTFRKICRCCGAGMTYTEMVSAKGLYYNDKKTAELMTIDDAERPCTIQIFGSDADIMAAVIPKVMEYKPDLIDINMGCPTPKIVNNGDGSALLKTPEKIGEIVRAVADASPVPLTVKIRAGWDEASINAVETAKIIEQSGAAAVALHARTRTQFYSGNADWGLIAEVKHAVKIPVIGNGDIFTPQDAEKMFRETGCDAVMVGRGAQGNPFIFRQINEYLETGEVVFNPTPSERISQAAAHLEMLIEEKGESRAAKEARKHIAWYIKGLPCASRFKEKIFKTDSSEEMLALLREYEEYILKLQ